MYSPGRATPKNCGHAPGTSRALPSTETSYDQNGDAFTTQQTGFPVFGESLGETITVPADQGSLFGSHRRPALQIRWSEGDARATRCPNGSGSQQAAKYRPHLQELASAIQRRKRTDGPSGISVGVSWGFTV
jgi:hypothetical protein